MDKFKNIKNKNQYYKKIKSFNVEFSDMKLETNGSMLTAAQLSDKG